MGVKQPSKLKIPRTSSVYPEDISPPDSTHTNNRADSIQSSPNISPVTESARSSIAPLQTSKRYASNIPIPRGVENKGGEGASLYGWREKLGRVTLPDRDTKLTRWDDFSGEPTTSEAGKPAQTTPRTARFDFGHADETNDSRMGNSIQVSGGQRSRSVSDRLRKVASKASHEPPREREEWKGASGRTTIVKPLLDKPLPPGKSVAFPPGKIKHPDTPKSRPLHHDLEDSGLGLRTPNNQETNSRKIPPLDEYDETMKPIVPLKAGRNSPQSPLSSPTTRGPPNAIDPSFDTRSPLARNPSNEQIRDNPRISSSNLTPRNSRDSESPKPIEADFRSRMHYMHLEKQPPSRFSATTYATTTYDSPPATPRISSDSAPPLPSSPQSVLHRKRPVPVSGVPNSKATARKPTPSDIGYASKMLPKSPPEAEAVDRIASLQAKLDNLHRRRANLTTVIHELTHVMQPSSIAYDMASRQEIKKTVAGLNGELQEVTKEEHETGLKLHRALKRQDGNGMYEPTSLWVRRMTE